MVRWSGWLVVVTLVCAAAYEFALALGAGSLGPEPGDDVAGSGVVRAVALLAMLAAVVLAGFPRTRPWPAALFGPSAAAFLVAFLFTYDPYYAPTLRRYFDAGGFPLPWVVVAVVALADGVFTALRPRSGQVRTPVVLVVVLLATLFAGVGH